MSRATLVTHNVWKGQPLDRVRDNVTRLAKDAGQPLAIFLQESARDNTRWTIGGYVSYTGPDAGDGDNNRILVRDDVEILDSGHIRVPDGAWTWNGNDKPARVFVWVAVRWRGRVWVLVCVHRAPNGPKPQINMNANAWIAEHKALLDLADRLKKRWPNATIAFGGDWNATMREMADYRYSMRSFQKALDIRGKGEAVLHIDGFLMWNGEVLDAEKLAKKYGSDSHRPVVVKVLAG